MAASSSSVPFFANIREEDQNQMKQQHSSTAPTSSTVQAAPPPQKKKRNQPGTPNPDAEVIALSPKTLMATNRFICEVCNKGFQREQNLQLHRRGHNLPWKLKQKTTKEPKRKVYLCPEPTCVHHDPSRALGDLTGIKKHYSRKHGEKKWKCEKCSKRYAVQSDWKAHSKTCGTREYRCDCGTLFSRRDSFITHRAFCDALAQESARQPPNLGSTIGSHLYGNSNMGLGLSQVGPQISSMQDQNNQSNDMLRLGSGRPSQFDHLLPPGIGSSFRPPHPMHSSAMFMQDSSQNYHQEHQSQQGLMSEKPFHGLMSFSDLQNSTTNNPPPAGTNLFNLGFMSNTSSNSSSNANNNNTSLPSSAMLMPNHFNNENSSGGGSEGSNLFSNNMMVDQITSGVPSLYTTSVQSNTAMPHMSATALLQRAAQMGSTSSNNNTSSSLLRSFGSSSSKSERQVVPGGLSSMFGENNENHFQDLMNSFTSGNSSIFGSKFGPYDTNRTNLELMDQEPNNKPNQNLSGGGGGSGSDRLTRDFLGVGQIMRSMSGVSQRDQQQRQQQQQQQQQQHGLDMSSLDSDRNTAPSSQSFGGGGNFQ
ncbi:protein indeterminate-domain 5, chloroplastic [Quercus lobata]|uniref:protein indeterminate-domain 5, chloroplastic n=1 Tax=Quercus lobata TaxID=97700 RepID=UPI0012480C8B|nr:protein indeterminate-domain 5, chloroplastic [Quercus lobata]XP_030959957.1 protein indeterminate-domain 5, chloroplastic [Quercus lobata]XP_030959958.1 protein indeterminate-domain 5, chloroplastic [Quercus lobata]